MTARLIRRGAGRDTWHVALWRLLLAALALATVWLILSKAAAQQRVVPRLDVPGALPAARLDPQKLFERLLGDAGGALQNETQLDKVEVTWEEEQHLGQQGLDEWKQRLAASGGELIERGKDVDYLRQLAALLQPQMKQAERYRKLRIFVAKTQTPNACAFPGGRLVVTSALLDKAGSEAALVGVLGHELAHLDRGHLLRRMRQWKLAQERFASRNPASFSSDRLLGNLSLMQQLFSRPFGPAEELDADRDGIAWAYRAGYDPLALEQVYRTLENSGLAPAEFLPAFLHSHPLTAERRGNLRATLAQLRAADPKARLYVGRENLARRITKSQREFNE